MNASSRAHVSTAAHPGRADSQRKDGFAGAHGGGLRARNQHPHRGGRGRGFP